MKIDLEPCAEVRRHPEIYRPERSERERARNYLLKNPSVPLDDPYNFQDVTSVKFPLFIDASTIVFMGRVGEEPVTANFTIVNPTHRSFWFKIKTLSREMFKVQKTSGSLEKGKKAYISVIFYPNIKRPKPFCEYLNIYALHNNGTCPNVYEAFKRMDQRRPLKKRIYVDFIWHPHIGITQAFENGKLLDMLKSKLEPVNCIRRQRHEIEYMRRIRNKKRQRAQRIKKADNEEEKEKEAVPGTASERERLEKEKKEKKEQERKEKEERAKIAEDYLEARAKKSFCYELSLIDATFQHRKNVLERMLLMNRDENNKKSMMPSNEVSKIHAKIVKNKNRSRIETFVKNPKKVIDYQKLHKNTITPDEYADDLWKEYAHGLNKGNPVEDQWEYKHVNTKLDKTTNDEREMKELREEQRKDKEKIQKFLKEKKDKERAKKEKEQEKTNRAKKKNGDVPTGASKEKKK